MGDQQEDAVLSNLYESIHSEELNVTRKYDDNEQFEVIKMLWDVHQKEMLKFYENPYSYRYFNEEWYNFTKKRAQTISSLGVDNFAYDYEHGFKTYWPERLREIMKQKWDRTLKIMVKFQKRKGITQSDLFDQISKQTSNDEKIISSPISTKSSSTPSKEINKRELKDSPLLSDSNSSVSSITVSGFSKSENKKKSSSPISSSQSPDRSKHSRSISSGSKSGIDSMSRSSSSRSKSSPRSNKRKRSRHRKHRGNEFKRKKSVYKSSKGKSSSSLIYYFEQACIDYKSRSLSSCEKESKSLLPIRQRSKSGSRSPKRERSTSPLWCKYSSRKRLRERSTSPSRRRYNSRKWSRERSTSPSRRRYNSRKRSRERSTSPMRQRYSSRKGLRERSTSSSRRLYSSRKRSRKRSTSRSRRRYSYRERSTSLSRRQYSSKKRLREKWSSNRTSRKGPRKLGSKSKYWKRSSSRSFSRQRSRSNSLSRERSLKKLSKQRSRSRERSRSLSRSKSNSSQSSESKHNSLNKGRLLKDFPEQGKACKPESESQVMLKCKRDSRDDSKSSATLSILTDLKRNSIDLEKDCGILNKNTEESNKLKFQIPLEDILPENINDSEAHFFTAKEKPESVSMDETSDSKINKKTITSLSPSLDPEEETPKPLTEASLDHSSINTDATSMKLSNMLLDISHQLDPIKSELGLLSSAFDALLETMKNMLTDGKPMYYLAKDSRLALQLIHEKLRLICFSSRASIDRERKLVNEIQKVLNFDSLSQQETNFCTMYGMDIKQLAEVVKDHSPTEIRTFIRCALHYEGMTMIDAPQVDEVYNMMIQRSKLWAKNDPQQYKLI